MKTALLIYKGILLYLTVFLCILSIINIDSIIDRGMDILVLTICIIGALVSLCYAIIEKEDYDVLLLNNIIDKWLKK